MAKDYNKVVLTGRLVADPEMRFTPDGVAITKFRIAVNGWKKDEPATFVSIVAFKKTAEACGEYLKKGSRVLVDGSLTIRQYEKDGEKKSATEVVINEMQMLDSKLTTTKAAEESDDDIPF